MLWGTRAPRWLESTGPLVSPVLTEVSWDAAVAPMNQGDHVLLCTDGVWEMLADEDGRAEARFMNAIERASDGGASLLDAILADVDRELVGRVQPDDLTLLTASVIEPIGPATPR